MVLFHFKPSLVPGGFIGVDVFFVISGFLMTGIIIRGLTQQTFSIMEFYIARANRIIPALAALCITLLIFGFFFLSSANYAILGKHVSSSITFLSNFIFWQEAGYFDIASKEKWLLHTWSLSTEWQFYITYPLILITLHKLIPLNAIKKVILLGSFISFVGCILVTFYSANSAYYLFPTRAWEMLAGGVAYLYPLKLSTKSQKKTLEWVGIFLIIIASVFLSEDYPWPGYLGLIPVIGTFLIIQADRTNSIITNNIVFQSLGKWSYSIYLWHWPLVVAIYYFSLGALWIYISIFLSLLLGFLSHKYIEKIKFRRKLFTTSDFLKHIPIQQVAFIGVMSFLVYEYEPNSFLFPMPETITSSIKRGDYECFDKSYQHEEDDLFCKITEGNKKLFAYGDSHLYASLPALERVASEHDLELTYTGYSGCPPLIGIYPNRNDQNVKNCYQLNNKVTDYITSNHIEYVFLAARWTYYTEGEYSGEKIQYISTEGNNNIDQRVSIEAFRSGLIKTFMEYANQDIKVILMLQVPMQEDKPDNIYNSSIINGTVNQTRLHTSSVSLKKHIDFQRKTNEIILAEASKFNNITVIDPTSEMCNEMNCPIGTQETSYYFDDDHLSIVGSLQLKQLIEHNI